MRQEATQSGVFGAPAAAAADLRATVTAHTPAVVPSIERRTTLGGVVGIDASNTSGTWAWLGIPYARPPVGPLRWRAPVDADAWPDRRDATAFGHPCIQNGRIYGPGANNMYDATIGTTLNTPVGSEDCLTLNIWRPATAEGRLPVLFFVHGGSNISGYTADPVYDGANLARTANAVVVTANYRLGVLGFFDLAHLQADAGDEEASGNFALLDIMQALRFVRQNIATFDGDPDNVTLMGQSAGAINVWALLTSPASAGLFHKAIPLSGGISLASNLGPGSVPTLVPAEAHRRQATRLLHELLVVDGLAVDAESAAAYVATRTDAQIADYLRSTEATKILTTLLASGLTGSGPIPDGAVVPLDPIASIAAGRYHRMPILAGNTVEEGKLFAPFLALLGGPPGFTMGDAERFALMMSLDPDGPPGVTSADVIAPAYLPADASAGWTAKAATLTSIFMNASRDNVLATVASRQSEVWHYQFDWAQEPAPWNEVYGAAHAFDMPFIFGNFGPSVFANATNSAANEPGRLALAAAMMNSIAAFLHHGDPNNAALATSWPAWPARMHFDATLTHAQTGVR
jgi:para-nitrobenzyl esterase